MSAPYEVPRGYIPVGESSIDVRAKFITRTYNHLMGAIVLFTLLEVGFFTTGIAQSIAIALSSTSWLLVLGGPRIFLLTSSS